LSISATSLLLGFVAKQAGSSFRNTPSIVSAFHRLGLNGNAANSYLGLSSLIVALYIGFLAASATSAMRGEEADGSIESFLVRPVARWRWYLDRFALICGVVVVSGFLAGVFTWIGAASTHADVSVSALIQAGLNTVPPAICIIGIGLMAMGLVPRATAFVAYGLLIWSFLVKLLGDVLRLSHWILDTSVLQQMAPAPAMHPDWTSAAALVLVGALAALIGGLAFNRRDLIAR
jgi:ABC-2 type transport system permease protein